MAAEANWGASFPARRFSMVDVNSCLSCWLNSPLAGSANPEWISLTRPSRPMNKSGDFSRLSEEDRRAILEILLATKQGLPEEWDDYTYLIAGAPSDMWEKVPQAVNLNTWPATIFVGRDGLVKGIHSGFASPASGEFNRQLQEEFTSKIEQLLAEKPAQNLAETASASTKPGQ